LTKSSLSKSSSNQKQDGAGSKRRPSKFSSKSSSSQPSSNSIRHQTETVEGNWPGNKDDNPKSSIEFERGTNDSPSKYVSTQRILDKVSSALDQYKRDLPLEIYSNPVNVPKTCWRLLFQTIIQQYETLPDTEIRGIPETESVILKELNKMIAETLYLESKCSIS
jgi:hypothetical protein